MKNTTIDVYISPTITGIHYNRVSYALKTLLINCGLSWNISRTATIKIDIAICLHGEECPQAHITAQTDLRFFEEHYAFEPHGAISQEGITALSDGNSADGRLWTDEGRTRHLRFDLFGQAFWLLTGGHEPRGKDARHLTSEKRCALARLDLLGEPLVEGFSTLLSNSLGQDVTSVPRWKGSASAFAISHDIDIITYYPWMRCCKTLLTEADIKKSIQSFFIKDVNYWTFDKMLAEEEKNGFVGSLYFSAQKGKILNFFLKKKYDLLYKAEGRKFDGLFHRLKENKHEIGLHASLDAHKCTKQFSAEVEFIKRSAEVEKIGNRHHCWLLDVENPNSTLEMHDECGLEYDSSLHFYMLSGFRRGTCLPFTPYSFTHERPINTLQIPPTWMEDYFFTHSKHNNITDPHYTTKQMIDTVRKHNGLFISVFHQHFFCDVLHKSEKELYMFLLNEMASQDNLMHGTPISIVSHWKERTRYIEGLSNEKYMCTLTFK